MKSVQRGDYIVYSATSNQSFSVPIDTIDPKKSLLLMIYTNTLGSSNKAYLCGLSEDSIIITASQNSNRLEFSWQVIEFY